MAEETTVDADPIAIERFLINKYSWEKFVGELIPWIYSHTMDISKYLDKNPSKEDYKGTKVTPIEPPPISIPNDTKVTISFPRRLMYIQGDRDMSESDSDSEDDIDDVNVAGIARLLAQNRSPRKAEQWAKQKLNTPKPPAPVQRKSTPLFISSSESEEEEEREVKDVYQVDSESEEGEVNRGPYQVLQEVLGIKRRSSIPPKQPIFVSGQRKSGNSKGAEIASRGGAGKRSIFDEQPDARRISFDSSRNTPQQEEEANITPVNRKRQRSPSPAESSASSALSDYFKEDYNPPVDTDRLARSRTSAASRRSPPPVDPSEQILDNIHGRRDRRSQSPTIHGSGGVRKGRGFGWTNEQEKFLIGQIETYGCAWADIARKYCKKGEILEGRDQLKLKDKARNIKEKCIRYVSVPADESFTFICCPYKLYIRVDVDV